MSLNDIVEKLQSSGSEQTRKILLRHGAKEPVLGVKVEELKSLLKGNKGNNDLAKELFATGIYDAMYLAGLMADGSQLTENEIDGWAKQAYGAGIGEYTIPWVATENSAGLVLALRWIDDQVEEVAVTGWSTLSAILSVWPNASVDLGLIETLLERVQKTIHQSVNRVRYAMNGFIIATGCYVPELMETALSIVAKIGKVTVDMNGTACKIPSAGDYILKVNKMGRTGQKKKTAKC